MRLEYEDFYKIAKCLNEINNNIFTDAEIACSAYDYLIEYKYSKLNGKPTPTMKSLCENLVMDMDFTDYAEYENELDVETMDRVLKNQLEEI